MIHPVLNEKLPEVIKLFKEHNVQRAYAFGSVITDKFNDESDLDFLIKLEEEPDPLVRGERLWDLYYGLENLFHRKIDLLTEEQLKNPYLIQSINSTKTLIYGG